MKDLITYSPAGWIEDASYSVVPGKENNAITCVTLLDAMHYCSWKENSEMLFDEAKRFFAGMGVEVTEPGSYNFSKINDDSLPTPIPSVANRMRSSTWNCICSCACICCS